MCCQNEQTRRYWEHAGKGHPHPDPDECTWCNPEKMKALEAFIEARDKPRTKPER